MKKILILNGPNLGRLGKREPSVYGSSTLADLESTLKRQAQDLGAELRFFQSNHLGHLIDEIERAVDDGFDAMIINPGGLTHTSVALRDAIAGAGLPAVEVHISNIYQRESFRHRSLTAGACTGVISGLGLGGYQAALTYLVNAQ